MKKAFQIIGICALTCFSFYYTDKMVELSKSKDPIMEMIESVQDDYNVLPVNAYVKDNTITSGVAGSKIDINQSYEKMKRLGEYNKNLLVFVPDMPKVTIKDNYDNFVIGASDTKREVSIAFIVDNDTNLASIIEILKNNEVAANFFVDGKFIESNEKLMEQLVNNGNYLGNLGYDGKYDSTRLKYTNTLIYKYMKSSSNYCYSDDLDVLNACKKENMYTVKGIEISSNNPYSNLKKNLKNGIIITFDTDKYMVDNLDLLIKYIKQKGYEIKLLDDLLKE